MSTHYRTEKNILMRDLFDGRLARYGVVEFIAEPLTQEEREALERQMKQGIDAEHIEKAERLQIENSWKRGNRCLSDGRNYLWCFPAFADDHTPTEHLGGLTRYAGWCFTEGHHCGWAPADFGRGSMGRPAEELVRYGMNAPQRILRAIAETFDTDIFSEYEPQFWGFASEGEWDAAQQAMAREYDDQFSGELINYVTGQPHDIKPGTVGATQAEIAVRLVAERPYLLNDKQRLLDEVRAVYDRDHAVTVHLTLEDLALVKLASQHEDDMPRA